MLTRSNWHTEPRSNRYHYATRFGRQLPVLFVQQTASPGDPLRVEPNVAMGIDVVHIGTWCSDDYCAEFLDLLRARAIRKPLIWVYGIPDYVRLLDQLRGHFTVLHATEDFNFLKQQKVIRDRVEQIEADAVAKELWRIDLLVCVSEGVLESFVTGAAFRGVTMLAANGCDAERYLEIADRAAPKAPRDRVAIYQGGINFRLDFDLLLEVARRLPDWQFRFCGRADESLPAWGELKARPNVSYLGELAPDLLAAALCEATVGLIPFVTTDYIRNSLPLKAFEYVACGLPVASVPIDALQANPDLFRIARTAADFVQAIIEIAPSRNAANALALRRRAALSNSYDLRFESVIGKIEDTLASVKSGMGALNIAILYDDRSTHIGCVREHLDAFRKYSNHNIVFIPATSPSRSAPPLHWSVIASDVDLSVFDVGIVHYAVRLSYEEYFNPALAQKFERFSGLKVLFIQDEYDSTETARRWMDRLQFDVVYTCVPREGIEFVYPGHRFPATEFLPTLTGYVPEAAGLERFGIPMCERSIRIGYRGRALAFGYGELGHEKYRIGVDMRRLAEERGIAVDIEVLDSRRIYGDDWYRFVGSVRAVLGTESGANVFDFDGSIHRAVTQYRQRRPNATFEEVHATLVAPHDGKVKMNQVSPKIFEAIRLRTALVLFEGSYSGVVRPGEHFIPLAKDYSNVDEVFRKLEDVAFLEALTDRAYRDIVASGRYSFATFVAGIDADINKRVTKGPAFEIFSTPVLARDGSGRCRVVAPKHPIGFSISSRILSDDLQRERLAEMVAPVVAAGSAGGSIEAIALAPLVQPRAGSRMLRVVRLGWTLLPLRWRVALASRLRAAMQRAQDGGAVTDWDIRLLRRLWRLLPASVRTIVLGRLGAR